MLRAEGQPLLSQVLLQRGGVIEAALAVFAFARLQGSEEILASIEQFVYTGRVRIMAHAAGVSDAVFFFEFLSVKYLGHS